MEFYSRKNKDFASKIYNELDALSLCSVCWLLVLSSHLNGCNYGRGVIKLPRQQLLHLKTENCLCSLFCFGKVPTQTKTLEFMETFNFKIYPNQTYFNKWNTLFKQKIKHRQFSVLRWSSCCLGTLLPPLSMVTCVLSWAKCYFEVTSSRILEFSDIL